jgi:hypothetical protein
MYRLLERLQLIGAYGIAIERQCGSWQVRCVFAAEADAMAVAQAVQARIVGPPSTIWSSERAFEADSTRLARFLLGKTLTAPASGCHSIASRNDDAQACAGK